jgi:hypothetical protein
MQRRPCLRPVTKDLWQESTTSLAFLRDPGLLWGDMVEVWSSLSLFKAPFFSINLLFTCPSLSYAVLFLSFLPLCNFSVPSPLLSILRPPHNVHRNCISGLIFLLTLLVTIMIHQGVPSRLDLKQTLDCFPQACVIMCYNVKFHLFSNLYGIEYTTAQYPLHVYISNHTTCLPLSLLIVQRPRCKQGSLGIIGANSVLVCVCVQSSFSGHLYSHSHPNQCLQAALLPHMSRGVCTLCNDLSICVCVCLVPKHCTLTQRSLQWTVHSHSDSHTLGH